MRSNAFKSLAFRSGAVTVAFFGLATLLVALPSVSGQQVDQDQVEVSDEVSQEEGGSKETATELDGPIVPINPVDDSTREVPKLENRVVPAKAFWIGIQGRTVQSPVLRTHLQLADDLGVVIEQVVPESPADKAGLRQHDVIIAAAGEPLQDMRALQKLVLADEGKPIELKILRLAKEKTVTVKPAERPADLSVNNAIPNRQGIFGGNPDAARLMQKMLQGRGLPQARIFQDDGNWQAAIPGGVSIQMQRQNGELPKITVKRGDETWEIVGDDAKALEKLPEDLRDTVSKLLQGNNLAQFNGGFGGGGVFGDRLPGERDLFGGGFDIEEELRNLLPERRPRQRMQDANPERDAREKHILDRMRELEKRLEAMQQQMDKPE
ncbi:MAG: PDZ domain-containing protein [Lacipirellulaceae bacterium]